MWYLFAFFLKKEYIRFMLSAASGGNFWKKQQPAKQRKTTLDIFRFSRVALNHVLTVPEYSRRRELSESCLNIFYLSIFDRFMAYRRSEKNFGPNVIYCFLGFNGNKRKHKFHGLVGPPAVIFEKNINLHNQEEHFWTLSIFTIFFKSSFDSARL